MVRPLVGIDGSRLTVPNRTGTENYTASLLAGLSTFDPGFETRTYLARDVDESIACVPGERRLLRARRFWTLSALSREMLSDKPDLLFVPSHVIPPIHPRSVVTIHDVGFRRFPAAHTRRRRLELESSTRWNLTSAERVIAVSEATRSEIVSLYDVDAERVSVVHHGVDERFFSAGSDQIQAVRTKLAFDQPFLLAVGTLQPRKNYEVLIRAFERAMREGLEYHLVIAGSRGWLSDPILIQIQQSEYRHAIHYLGYVDDSHLPALYASADCFVFPSLYEGFGMPVLESLASGTPVIASDIPSTREIAGDQVTYFKPDQADQLSDLMLNFKNNQMTTNQSRNARVAHAASFTWRKCAYATAAVLRSALAIM